MYPLLFFLEFVLLFLLSKILTKSLLRLFFSVTKNNKIAIGLLVFFFFPGTVIHELAHLLAAGLVFVKTGNMELMPKVVGNEIRLGSVEVVRTDPFRRAIIGVAPVLLGLFIIFGILFYLQAFPIKNIVLYLFSFYIIFAVGNTLFSSKKDLEGAVEFLLAMLLLLSALFIVKIEIARAFFQLLQKPETASFFRQADLFLVVPVLLDLLIVIFVRFLVGKR
jgi:ABC-type transport system involved in multi-copper enzyme maturation permease subunit